MGRKRTDVASVRDEVADQRDRVSTARDLTAQARDVLERALDTQVEEAERELARVSAAGVTSDIALTAAADRREAARSRGRAAAQRISAEADREHAAEDRAMSAADRTAAANEIAKAGVDELTGSLRRSVGLAAMERELERAHRSGEPLVVAFLDVDGLKAINDEQGHAVGDQLLEVVVDCLEQGFRSYDFVTRVGGDEFACCISGEGLADLGERFESVAACVAETVPGGAISVGLGFREPEDTVATLMARADDAMYSVRGRR